MGNEQEENKKNAKKKKLLKKIEKKQKNSNNLAPTPQTNIHKYIFNPLEDIIENDAEVEEFKKKIQLDSIHARNIKKIKPNFTKRWIEDIRNML